MNSISASEAAIGSGRRPAGVGRWVSTIGRTSAGRVVRIRRAGGRPSAVICAPLCPHDPSPGPYTPSEGQRSMCGSSGSEPADLSWSPSCRPGTSRRVRHGPSRARGRRRLAVEQTVEEPDAKPSPPPTHRGPQPRRPAPHSRLRRPGPPRSTCADWPIDRRASVVATTLIRGKRLTTRSIISRNMLG